MLAARTHMTSASDTARLAGMQREPRVTGSVVPAARAGDDRRGFEVSVDVANRILRVRSWGIWDVDLAERYRDAMVAAFAKLGRRPWSVLSDRRRSHSQSEPVQAIMHDVMEKATEMGRSRAAVLITSPSAKLQMRRLAGETHVAQRYFDDDSDALAWLLSTPA
jgi:hypothetical protein